MQGCIRKELNIAFDVHLQLTRHADLVQSLVHIALTYQFVVGSTARLSQVMCGVLMFDTLSSDIRPFGTAQTADLHVIWKKMSNLLGRCTERLCDLKHDSLQAT